MSELFSRWLHDVEPAPAAGSAPAHAAAADRPTARRAARPSPDSLLLEAVDAARSAIAEVADPNHIGAHLGAVMEGQRLATHSFACTAKAYRLALGRRARPRPALEDHHRVRDRAAARR